MPLLFLSSSFSVLSRSLFFPVALFFGGPDYQRFLCLFLFLLLCRFFLVFLRGFLDILKYIFQFYLVLALYPRLCLHMLSSSTPWSPPSFCPSVSGEPPQRERQIFFLLSSLLVVFEVAFLHLALSQQTRLLRKPSQPKKKQTEKRLFSASYMLTCLSFFLCWFVSLAFFEEKPRANCGVTAVFPCTNNRPPVQRTSAREREGKRPTPLSSNKQTLKKNGAR